MQFKDNPEFIEALRHEASGAVFYMPAETSSYHKSREMAMQVQERYSQCGISREVLTSFADTLLEFANKQLNTDTLRTDIGTIANNLKYRMSAIVDEQCALRMGAIALFLEGEDPNTVAEVWTNKKVNIAKQHPDVYAFFLNMGIALTPEYANCLRTLTAEDYLRERQIMISSLTLNDTLAA